MGQGFDRVPAGLLPAFAARSVSPPGREISEGR